LINDKNTIYSVHFFYPPQFTFYTTANERMLMKYPGEMTTAGVKIGEIRTANITGTTEWRKLNIKAVPPDGAEILMVNIISDSNNGTVWFDDVYLKKDGVQIGLPAPLVFNNSFEIDYPGINWNTQGVAAVTSETARTGSRSLMFSMNKDAASALSSPVDVNPVRKGLSNGVNKGTYSLTAWVKSINATGNNFLSLSWHKRKAVAYVDRNVLLERLRYALEFKKKNNVPLFVGEFTVHANPYRDSVINYLKDIVEIMRDEGLHWSYWTYYSEYPGIGIYTGNNPHLARPEEMNMLKKYMRNDGN
jgi:hypothetical protein